MSDPIVNQIGDPKWIADTAKELRAESAYFYSKASGPTLLTVAADMIQQLASARNSMLAALKSARECVAAHEDPEGRKPVELLKQIDAAIAKGQGMPETR